MSLSVTFEKNPSGLHVVLSGVIDENADLNAIADIGSDAVIDMSGIERITSPGVVIWVMALSKISAAHKIVLRRVSHAMGTHGQSILGMFGRCVVESCMAPYFCAGCGANFDILVTREMLGTGRQPPSHKCDNCGGALDFDELDEYLAFMFEAER